MEEFNYESWKKYPKEKPEEGGYYAVAREMPCGNISVYQAFWHEKKQCFCTDPGNDFEWVKLKGVKYWTTIPKLEV